MGYLIAAHVMNQEPDPSKLSALPVSIAWSLYRDDGGGPFYLDTFRTGRKQNWPFTSMPSAKDLSLDLAKGGEGLAITYKALEEALLANSFNRAYFNLNLALSEMLQMPVCSFCSDDDLLDFACVSNNGNLTRLHCECGDLDIVCENGQVTIQPLLVEEEGLCTNVTNLHDPATGVDVLERNVDQSRLLHHVASIEVVRFLGVKKAPLGLGSFEGLETVPQKISSSIGTGPDTPKSGVRPPWWKFWR